MTDVAHVLLGGALVVLGVIATALADRIRGVRTARAITASAVTRPRSIALPPEAVRVLTVKPTEERASMLRTSPPRSSVDRDRGAAAAKRHSRGADEVIAALVASGHSRSIATQAVWDCGHADRETVETWTVAALRRCARGVVS